MAELHLSNDPIRVPPMPLGIDMPLLTAGEAIFICPQTKLPLRPMSLQDAKKALGSDDLITRTNAEKASFGVTSILVVRADNACAYPVVGGIPILLAPEQITPASRPQSFDLEDVKYAEAYQEMTFYNKVGQSEAQAIRQSQAYQVTEPVIRLQANERRQFPEPNAAWLDCVPDCKAQYES